MAGIGSKKLTRPSGSKLRVKKASVQSLNPVRAIDYGKRTPAPASAPAPGPVQAPAAPAPVQVPEAPGALVPAPAPGAVNPPVPAVVGKGRVRVKVSDA